MITSISCRLFPVCLSVIALLTAGCLEETDTIQVHFFKGGQGGMVAVYEAIERWVGGYDRSFKCRDCVGHSKIDLGFPHVLRERDYFKELLYGGTIDQIDNHRGW